MADSTVTSLTALAQSGFANGDTLYIADVSVPGLAGSKKTTVADILGDGTTRLMTSAGTGSLTLCTASTFLNTLTGSATTSNFLNVTGTLPSSLTATCYGVFLSITGAGSSARTQVALNATLNAGYTGSSTTAGVICGNTSAGTGTTYFNGGVANYGMYNTMISTTTGTNVGCLNYASGGSTSLGSYSQTTVAKDSATNIAVLGFSLNTGSSPTHLAGYFGLHSTPPTYASAALMCDNGSTTSDIFVARDNGTACLTVADGGLVTATGTVKALGLAASGDNSGIASTTSLTNATNTTLTNAYVVKGGQAATTVNTGWLKVYVGTTVSWVPYWSNATP